MAGYVLAQNGNRESLEQNEKYFCYLKWYRIMGIDQPTYVHRDLCIPRSLCICLVMQPVGHAEYSIQQLQSLWLDPYATATSSECYNG